MVQLYPDIGDIFALVAGRIHAGQSPHRIMQDITPWVTLRVKEQHLKPVLEKLRKFAYVLRDNNPEEQAAEEPELPAAKGEVCPCCGSIEYHRGKCRWCIQHRAG
jgi:hypothetical protein